MSSFPLHRTRGECFGPCGLLQRFTIINWQRKACESIRLRTRHPPPPAPGPLCGRPFPRGPATFTKFGSVKPTELTHSRNISIADVAASFLHRKTSDCAAPSASSFAGTRSALFRRAKAGGHFALAAVTIEQQQGFATLNWDVTRTPCMIPGNSERGAPVRLVTREIAMIRKTELALAAAFVAGLVSVAHSSKPMALPHDYAVAFDARAQVPAPQVRPCIPQYDSTGVQRPPYCHRW